MTLADLFLLIKHFHLGKAGQWERQDNKAGKLAIQYDLEKIFTVPKNSMSLIGRKNILKVGKSKKAQK
jgi:hypothetical protein